MSRPSTPFLPAPKTWMPGTSPGFPEPAPAFGRGCEVDFAGVLDRQYMATFCRRRRAFAPAFDNAFGRHLGIAEKAVEPHLPGATPLASRRRQTSLPATMHSMSAAPLYRDDDPRTDPTTSQSAPTCRHLRHRRSAAIEITWIPDSGIPLASPESIRRTRSVHALGRTPGPIRRGPRFERRCWLAFVQPTKACG